MEKIKVHIQYLGVIRLLINKKEEIFFFQEKPNLKILLETIASQYGKEVDDECKKQMFILYQPGDRAGKVMETQDLVEDGTLVKIVSLVTGG